MLMTSVSWLPRQNKYKPLAAYCATLHMEIGVPKTKVKGVSACLH